MQTIIMNRDSMIQQLDTQSQWDICIIGGGATGLGIAVDAASRGLKTVLFEQHDFAKGTSSRSTKLVHGGVRYLQQGNIRLVMEALKERGILLKNAPHLVHNQKFIVPNYKWWEGPFYGIGLKLYDWMSGRLGLGPSQFLSREETLKLAPTLDPDGLRGSIVYHDGQFDDARLAISLAQTAAHHGAAVLNYFPVKELLKENNRITGVRVKNQISGKEYHIKTRVVVNATGVFTDSIMNMDDPGHQTMISPSQGIHLVVDSSFLPGQTAILIPRTDDGRVLFAVPWHQKVVLGTTDTPVNDASLEPVPQQQEIEFILSHVGRYLTRDPQLSDVKSMFAGLRPLVKGKTKKTAALSRDHSVNISDSGLISIIGGKWTTYRKMAEDVVDMAIERYQLEKKPCITGELRLDQLSPQPAMPLPLNKQNIQQSIRQEMCLTVEDYLSRRSRLLLLDAKEAINCAPQVASIMAEEMGKDRQWEEQQVNDFIKIANNYLPTLQTKN